jgi:hypothetical protein
LAFPGNTPSGADENIGRGAGATTERADMMAPGTTKIMAFGMIAPVDCPVEFN